MNSRAMCPREPKSFSSRSMSLNKRSQRNLVQLQSRGSLRPTTARVTLGCCASLLLILHTASAALRVPAFTSYLEPGPVLGMAETNDISAPRSLVPHLLWFGEFTQAGRVDCSIALHVPRGRECWLILLTGGETNRATVKGSEVDEQIVSLGSITIKKP